MTPQEVKEYFKTGYKFKKQTKMSENNIPNWLTTGYVPFVSQKRIELITKGELVAEWDERELLAHNKK